MYLLVPRPLFDRYVPVSGLFLEILSLTATYLPAITRWLLPFIMPSLYSCSVLRDTVENLRIALHARHIFVAGDASENVLKLKGRLPDEVDVIMGTNLVFTLAGTANSTRIAPAVVRQSAVVQHILGYLRAVCMTLRPCKASAYHLSRTLGRLV